MLDCQTGYKSRRESEITVSAAPKVSRVEVYWHTVTYRTVLLYIFVLITILLTLTYLVFPRGSATIMSRISDAISPHDSGVATITAKQARFVNLDGKVQVKK